MKHTFFTAEQEAWLIDNFHKVNSYAELTEKFNIVFSETRNESMIKDKCVKRLKLKGMKNLTRFGIKERSQLPVGTVRRSQTGTYIKVMEVPYKTNFSGYAEPYWIPLQKKIYQDAYGSIRDDQMVCFLDGNTQNFELQNLYAIDRKISACMSHNRWWTDSREHTLTAIKWCELFYALKNMEA